MRASARTADRGPKAVLANLNELENYGLVTFEEDGRAKRPYLAHAEIDIDIQPLPVVLGRWTESGDVADRPSTGNQRNAPPSASSIRDRLAPRM